MKKMVFILVCAFLCSLSVWSQSNDIIDALLEEDKATWGNAAYMIVTASGQADDSVSAQESIEIINSNGWGVSISAPDSPVQAASFAAVLMKAFALDGGLMYRIFPVSRYAFRDMRFKGLMLTVRDPDKKLSGPDVLNILNEVMAKTGEDA